VLNQNQSEQSSFKLNTCSPFRQSALVFNFGLQETANYKLQTDHTSTFQTGK